MKFRYLIYACLLSALTVACGQKNTFRLYVALNSPQDSVLYLLQEEPAAQWDTLHLSRGTVEHIMTLDTFTLIRLYSPSGRYVPIFGTAGEEVRITGSIAQPKIEGKGFNADYATLADSIAPLKTWKAQQEKARAFLRSHPSSLASAYVLAQFFAEDPKTSIDEVQQLLAPLDGDVKDTWTIIDRIGTATASPSGNNSFPYLSLKDRNGKFIEWKTAPDKAIIIHLWASWDSVSTAAHDSLYHFCRQQPKKNFSVISISLDINRREWIKACQPDNDYWTETCDFSGWKHTLVERQGIQTLPYTYLLNNLRIIQEKQPSIALLRERLDAWNKS